MRCATASRRWAWNRRVVTHSRLFSPSRYCQGADCRNTGVNLDSIAETDAFAAEAEASGQKPIHGLIDGVRAAQHQRFDAIGGERIGSALANPSVNHA